MGDGNFNRSHLPVNPYQSGQKAGLSQMRVRAIETFARWLAEQYPNMGNDEMEEQKRHFARMLHGDS